MQLKDWLDPLRSVLRLGSSRPEAWRNLVSLITVDEDSWVREDAGIEARMSDGQLNKIFSGTRQLGADYAGAILGSEYDPQALYDRIENLPDKVRSALVKKYRNLGEDVDEASLAQWCVTWLTTFLSAPLEQDDPLAVGAREKIEELTLMRYAQGLKSLLIAQAGGVCPHLECNNRLVGHDDAGNTVDLCEVVQIDPANRQCREDNFIILCSECARRYTGTNEDEMRALATKRQVIQDKYDHAKSLKSGNIEDAIKRVLVKLQKHTETPQTFDEDIDGPLKVKEKIPNDFLLQNRILSHVTTWFKYVHTALQHLDYSDDVTFEIIKNAIHGHYLKLQAKSLSHHQIVEHLTDYLVNTTDERRDACEIVVAYFVQDCEVFDAIS